MIDLKYFLTLIAVCLGGLSIPISVGALIGLVMKLWVHDSDRPVIGNDVPRDDSAG